jgi:hypothetical protein
MAQQALTGTASLTGLFPGTYTVTAATVNVSGTSYSPTPSVATHDISASLTPRQASVAYTVSVGPPPPAFNLAIDGMYVTQVVQRYPGDVPLVAGRPVPASSCGRRLPTRAAIGTGPTLPGALCSDADPGGTVDVRADGNLGGRSPHRGTSASRLRSSSRAFAFWRTDPTNAIQEADEADNSFPVDGSPGVPPLQTTLPLNLAFVPVAHSSNGATGNVTAGNMEQYLAMARKVLPIKDIVPTLHAVFATSTPPVESNDGNASWIQILGEINALRTAEGSSDYYMGIVNALHRRHRRVWVRAGQGDGSVGPAAEWVTDRRS